MSLPFLVLVPVFPETPLPFLLRLGDVVTSPFAKYPVDI
jgi:hypothetical protein